VTPASFSAEELTEAGERARNVELATKVFGLTVDAAGSGSTANFTGIKMSGALFSRRLDSRTYFVQDLAAKGESFYAGSDEEIVKKARAFLLAVGVPASEVASARVLQEQLAVVRYEPGRNPLENVAVTKGKRYALLERKLEGVTVFSSRELLTLTGKGSIDYLEMHWPEIPSAVVAEARRLQARVKAGWKPPEQRGATIESVEAGIVHSPAAAFVMDFMPAIRVIYAPSDSKVGVKPAIYYDRHGIMVAMPREHEKTAEVCPAIDRRSQLK